MLFLTSKFSLSSYHFLSRRFVVAEHDRVYIRILGAYYTRRLCPCDNETRLVIFIFILFFSRALFSILTSFRYTLFHLFFFSYLNDEGSSFIVSRFVPRFSFSFIYFLAFLYIPSISPLTPNERNTNEKNAGSRWRKKAGDVFFKGTLGRVDLSRNSLWRIQMSVCTRLLSPLQTLRVFRALTPIFYIYIYIHVCVCISKMEYASFRYFSRFIFFILFFRSLFSFLSFFFAHSSLGSLAHSFMFDERSDTCVLLFSQRWGAPAPCTPHSLLTSHLTHCCNNLWMRIKQTCSHILSSFRGQTNFLHGLTFSSLFWNFSRQNKIAVGFGFFTEVLIRSIVVAFSVGKIRCSKVTIGKKIQS